MLLLDPLIMNIPASTIEKIEIVSPLLRSVRHAQLIVSQANSVVRTHLHTISRSESGSWSSRKPFMNDGPESFKLCPQCFFVVTFLPWLSLQFLCAFILCVPEKRFTTGLSFHRNAIRGVLTQQALAKYPLDTDSPLWNLKNQDPRVTFGYPIKT
jgi:hypothetical protein